MIGRKIREFINTLPWREIKIITRHDNLPYLTRFYIYRKHFKWMPSLYLHCFHSGDEDQELHSHPWSHSVSFIVSGRYKEEYRDGDIVKSRELGPGNINYVPKDKFHRIDLLTEEVWTIFISGPKVSSWGFWNRDTNEYVPWKEHLENRK